MSAIALTRFTPVRSVLDLRAEFERRQPQLAAAAQLALLAMVPCLLAMQIDPRLTNGISVWIKPTKFLLSFAVYYATLAWFFGYLPRAAQHSRAGRFVIGTALVAGLLEMLWLIAAAAHGVPSHYNVDALPWGLAYSAAGAGAVLLIAAILVQGLLLARDREVTLVPVFRASLVAGAVVAFVTTLLAAGYLSAANGHWVGALRSDAGGLPVMGWSRSGGDLRVAHFWALHAHQAIPAAGSAPRRRQAAPPACGARAGRCGLRGADRLHLRPGAGRQTFRRLRPGRARPGRRPPTRWQEGSASRSAAARSARRCADGG